MSWARRCIYPKNWRKYLPFAAQRSRYCPVFCPVLALKPGGETGIRTLDTVSRIHAFQACAFSHSAISPWGRLLRSGADWPRPFIVAQGRDSRLSSARRSTDKKEGRTAAFALFFLFELLREVILVAHLFDGMQLRFEPIDMMLFVAEDLLSQFP